MKKFLAKFNDKAYIQNMLIELIGDLFMLSLGLLVGYYIKVYIIGF